MRKGPRSKRASRIRKQQKNQFHDQRHKKGKKSSRKNNQYDSGKTISQMLREHQIALNRRIELQQIQKQEELKLFQRYW